jgi:hypothetical protein
LGKIHGSQDLFSYSTLVLKLAREVRKQKYDFSVHLCKSGHLSTDLNFTGESAGLIIIYSPSQMAKFMAK